MNENVFVYWVWTTVKLNLSSYVTSTFDVSKRKKYETVVVNIPLLKQKYLKQNHVQDKREDKIAKFPQVTVAVTIHFTIFKSVFEDFESIYNKLPQVTVSFYESFVISRFYR